MKKDNLINFLQFKNQTETSVDLYFYGDIVSSWYGAWDDADQYPERVRDFLKDYENKDLNIYINSGGGSVFAGMAIYNMLKRHKGTKTVYVDGLAGSIASVIAMAGDRIVVPKNSFLMIHKPLVGVSGNANELRETADLLDNIEQAIINVYQDNIVEGVDIETIKEMVNDETWLNGEEASQYFNIELAEENKAVAKVESEYLNKICKNIPENLNNQVEENKEIENNTKDEPIILTNYNVDYYKAKIKTYEL
ncbi:ATP-dependent Clp protease proteolytic subunit [Romboutsia sp. 1001216sp1]|uniref:head maturation protease, ClpP-related n=1 Tax=Romboutsia sp. 1001216sp1 TaxID=2986997 RepID=UPI00232AD76D|nr:head maturation protease, ClpP-related [Romboutsia sp. 1001216sp1]MDB8790881.1 ATP-dependent Clp protease proteolytic subunit [Romboutsia sp. 1001216sp1]